MSEYGLKMLNIEASSLYEYNKGLRRNFNYTRSMLTNSILLDFLKDNGLKIEGDGTKDIICLEFNSDCKSFKSEQKYLCAMMLRNSKIVHGVNATEDDIAKANDTRRYIAERYKQLKANKHLYEHITKEELRRKFYNDGVTITYNTYAKDGSIKSTNTIRYVRLFRSCGKAKQGTVNFIRDGLFPKTDKFLHMGIKVPKTNTPIVEFESYIPLIASSIVGTIHINPRNILTIADVSSSCREDVISIETDENNQCFSRLIKDYEVSADMFDGQALIDSSLFPTWANGYILLRQHFTKIATFNCNLQQYFKDYYGDDYDTAKVTDYFGVSHYVKDIEMVTTQNAFKWTKFGVTYDEWCNEVMKLGCKWGIVKTAHPSKLGDVQRASYQIINSLDVSIMPNVCKESLDYIEKLKTDDEVFIEYLLRNANLMNDFEAIVALVNQDHDFVDSEYYRERKASIINSYVSSFRRGKVIQRADNLVFVGSPYAMLLSAVGEDVDKDITLCPEDNGCVQCYTEFFDNDEYLAVFRSPHNSKNNIGYLHNVRHPMIKKYFNFGTQILALNTRHTSIEDRLNG